MAAHSITVLLELAESCHRMTPEKTEQYLHALDYAPGMDELDMDAWHGLRVALQMLEKGNYKMACCLRKLVISILGTQITEWEKLGQPESHEDWVKAKYGGE